MKTASLQIKKTIFSPLDKAKILFASSYSPLVLLSPPGVTVVCGETWLDLSRPFSVHAYLSRRVESALHVRRVNGLCVYRKRHRAECTVLPSAL
jgi:hypothetical protein